MTRSLSPRQTQNLTADLRRILGFTTVGGRRWSNLILTAHRTVDWQNPTVPTGGGPRGGTSTATETAERVEDRKVAWQADRDHHDLPALIDAFQAELTIASVVGAPTRELAQVAERLAQIIVRHTQPIDHTLLPDDGPPGCKSCARLGRTKNTPGYFQPVSTQERYAKKQLCTWCGRHSDRNVWPPLDAIDVRVTQGEHAAARWLARNPGPSKKRKRGRAA